MRTDTEHVRAVLLAALVVVAPVAGTIAISETAAAASDITVDSALSPTTVDEQSTVSHDVTVTVAGVAADSGTDSLAVGVLDGVPVGASIDAENFVGRLGAPMGVDGAGDAMVIVDQLLEGTVRTHRDLPPSHRIFAHLRRTGWSVRASMPSAGSPRATQSPSSG